jgi:hypothetical protein
MKHDLELLLIVMMCKITSAFDDITEIEDEKIFKGQTKREIKRFQEWYNKFSKELCLVYYNKNAAYFEDIISAFNKYETQITDFDSEKHKRMILAGLKLRSASKDIERVSVKEHGDIFVYVTMIQQNLTKLTRQGFWNQYLPPMMEANHKDVQISLKNFGELIYMKKVEEEEK